MTLPEDPNVHRRVRMMFRRHGVEHEKLAREIITYIQSHTAIALARAERQLNPCPVCGATKKVRLK